MENNDPGLLGPPVKHQLIEVIVGELHDGTTRRCGTRDTELVDGG